MNKETAFEDTLAHFDEHLLEEDRGVWPDYADLGWYEGYASALANFGLITEQEFDDLLTKLALWKREEKQDEV